jgi:hypothetical protein
VGCRPYSKNSTKSGLDPGYGFNAFSVGLSSSLGTILGSASSVVTVGSSSLVPKALGCSSVEFLVSSVHASSSPPKLSSPAVVVEKFSEPLVLLGDVGVRAPIYPLDSKQVQRYYRKAKKGSVAQVDASLIAEAVEAINVPIAQSLGVPSQPPIGAVDQSSTTLGQPSSGGVGLPSPFSVGFVFTEAILFGVWVFSLVFTWYVLEGPAVFLGLRGG